MDTKKTVMTQLSKTERVLMGLCENINENSLPKKLQGLFHNTFGRHVVRLASSNLLQVTGLENVQHLTPEKGVLMCSNHRSFFDMYVISSVLRNNQVHWLKDIFFPVRSNFFYDQWKGLAVNLAISGGAMYPPIFRDRKKSGLNQLAVKRIINILEKPGAVVGVHPEGKRGQGDNPYELLPAKRGVGEMALRSNAVVLPIWVSGIGNDFTKQVISNFQNGEPVRIRFGAPVDLRDFARKDINSLRTQQETASFILEHIAKLGQDEQASLQKLS